MLTMPYKEIPGGATVAPEDVRAVSFYLAVHTPTDRKQTLLDLAKRADAIGEYITTGTMPKTIHTSLTF